MIARNIPFIGVLFILLAAVLICGCTHQPAAPVQTPVATTAPTPGMPNPASVYCEEIGGRVEIMKNPDGSEYGMCTFPNGTSCEEWALFRGEGCKPGSTVGMPNPASVYCEEIGGRVEIMKNPDGSEYGMCTFPNGTSCEEWALFRGEGCKPGSTVGMPNPASVYCEEIGGRVEIMKNPDGSEYGMCTFPNGTSCEEWALFRGEGCKA
ncbi:MAG TPA: DUF333 domain-containing protein [Methanoregulaceae archaeon]|nr:DUF333 domain-containing protein [Methanoregulaceae archaeon]HRU31067.1 DUF333 domain-containing protein [Methanoregulaceae archaeon]